MQKNTSWRKPKSANLFIPELFSSKAVYYNAMAGLLTYSVPERPSHFGKTEQWTYVFKTSIELTAAGQLRNHTVFPFNFGYTPKTKSAAKVLKYLPNNKQ